MDNTSKNYRNLEALKEEFEFLKKLCPAISLPNIKFEEEDRTKHSLAELIGNRDIYPPMDCRNPQAQWLKEIKYGVSNPFEISSTLFSEGINENIHTIFYHVSKIYKIVLDNMDKQPVLKHLITEKMDEDFDPFNCYRNCRKFVEWVRETSNAIRKYLEEAEYDKEISIF